jgi:hypothetical protein
MFNASNESYYKVDSVSGYESCDMSENEDSIKESTEFDCGLKRYAVFHKLHRAAFASRTILSWRKKLPVPAVAENGS